MTRKRGQTFFKVFSPPFCIENKNYRNTPQNTKYKVTGYYTIRARHKVRKEVKKYPRQYAHKCKQRTNKINVKNHKTHLSSVICLQISKYQEAKASKKEHTDTGDDILPKKCCNTGPDRDAVDDDNEHPMKDAHCHHLQLRIRVGVI